MQVIAPVAVLALALVLIGTWGRRHAAELAVVPGMAADRIAHRERLMRRGSTACLVVGVLFAGVAVLSLVFPP